jgi:hypothetical protein
VDFVCNSNYGDLVLLVCWLVFVVVVVVVAVLGFVLKASTVSHSTSPFFVMGFFQIGSPEPAILLISAS